MTVTITAVEAHDVRLPTAAAGDGSDAVNRGDYSATYVEVDTDAGSPAAGCRLLGRPGLAATPTADVTPAGPAVGAPARRSAPGPSAAAPG